MVTVELKKRPQLQLTASGHAGAAPYGEDLVCAAISTLLCTLAAQLEKTGGYARLEPGFATLRAERTKQAAAAFAFAETGLRLLAAQYPRHLQLTVR